MILLRFLHSLRDQLQNGTEKKLELFLLGDVFDFWLGGHFAFVQKFQPIVDVIAEIKKLGGQVVYFEGNHDFHIDAFWTKKLGIEVYADEKYFMIDGMNVRLEHGDMINLNDEAYLKYRAFIRNPWIEPIGHILPGAFWNWFGLRMSQKSRKRSSRYTPQKQNDLIQMIRDHARRSYQDKKFDLIITGHMHVYDDHVVKIGSDQARSINLGSWLEEPLALKLENGQITKILL